MIYFSTFRLSVHKFHLYPTMDTESASTDEPHAREFTSSLLQNLHGFQEGDKYTDVTLTAGDLSIRCHKVVLAAASQYFDSTFSLGMIEAQTNHVKLEAVDASVLKLIITCMYGTDIECDENVLLKHVVIVG